MAIWLVPVAVGMAMAVAAGLARVVEAMSMSMTVGFCGRATFGSR